MILMSFFSILEKNLELLSPEPYPKNFVLWFAGICLLVAVAGGGLIKIADKQIGKLKYGSRILSFILAAFGIVVYFLIPSQNLTIDGIFSNATFEKKLKHSYEVRLTPSKLTKVTNVGSEGFFNFYDTHEVTKGAYNLSVIKIGENRKEVVYDGVYNANPNKKHLLVIKKDEGFQIETERIDEYFMNQYFVEHDWMKKFQALRYLIVIVKNDKSVRGKFKTLLKSKNQKEFMLSHFVLGGSIESPEAQDGLIKIMEDETKYKIFNRLRAAALLGYYSGESPNTDEKLSTISYNFLMKYLLDKNIRDGPRNLTKEAHYTSAYFLAERGYKNQCVIDQLIEGLDHNDSELRNEYMRLLKKLTGKSEHNDYEYWKAWWESERSKYDVCSD